MDYAVGDLISFKRKQGAPTGEVLWSTPTRIIGFDGDRVAWGLCEGLPVCLATDKIRPCTPAETMAYLYLHKNRPNVDYSTGIEGVQHSYIDARTPEEDFQVPVVGLDGDPEEEMEDLPELVDIVESDTFSS